MTARDRFKEDYRAARVGFWRGLPSLARAEDCRRAAGMQDGLSLSYKACGYGARSLRCGAIVAGMHGRLP